MLYIGSHTSYLKDKGLLGVVNESISYGANIFMFYTGSNQSTLRFPIDKELIDVEMMSDEDIDWLNNYHKRVYDSFWRYSNRS